MFFNSLRKNSELLFKNQQLYEAQPNTEQPVYVKII